MRRAVEDFQDTEGLAPTGVADQRTWLQLLTPELQAKVPRTNNQILIAVDVANVRTGPATIYPAIDRRYKGEALDVTGQRGGASPETTWYQVCCVEQDHGWLRGDVGQFQGDIATVPQVSDAAIPPAPIASYARRGQPLLENLPDHTPEGNPIVYLSFDDGPNASGPNGGYTQEMLALLKRYQAHATFFEVGNSVATWPQLVRAVAADSHYVANHTWDHIFGK